MKSKVILSLLLCLSICMSFAGCSNEEPEATEETVETVLDVAEDVADVEGENADNASDEIEEENNEDAAVEDEADEEVVEEEKSEPILLFEDEFDGDELDDTKWKRCPEWTRQDGIDVWDDDLSFLDGEGHLVIRAEWNEEENMLHSGAVHTSGKYSETYAYYEASIKFPVAPGTWGAFWMMVGSVENVDGSAADGVEIDIIESIGNSWNQCNHALHWDGYGDAHTKTGKTMTNYDIYDGEYHTFGLWRTEEAYIFYIDGEETWRVESDECDPCPEPGYMKLTVEGAKWNNTGSAECIKSLPADMLVDYVRVYSEKPE